MNTLVVKKNGREVHRRRLKFSKKSGSIVATYRLQKKDKYAFYSGASVLMNQSMNNGHGNDNEVDDNKVGNDNDNDATIIGDNNIIIQCFSDEGLVKKIDDNGKAVVVKVKEIQIGDLVK